MDEELIARYRRWVAAETDAQDDEADAACRELFAEACEAPLPSLGFVARTMTAIADDTARSARRAQRTRRTAAVAASIGGVAAIYFGGALAVSAATRLVLGFFELVIGAAVRFATGNHAGAGLWDLSVSMGQAMTALVSDPKVTLALFVLQGVAITALVALQRLLGSDGESLK